MFFENIFHDITCTTKINYAVLYLPIRVSSIIVP